MIPRAKHYSVHIDFDFDFEVSVEELQGAIMRASKTPAFGIAGRYTINLVTPRDGIGPTAPEAPVPAILMQPAGSHGPGT
jgi:hypothetical protein